jgi:hypothetical protein
MENHDKIFNQIKTAAENAETKDFPSMDKVWTRVEDKLDQKVLKKENTLWKKIAVAASILLVVSIAYQYLSTKETEIVKPINPIVISETNDTISKENTNDSLVKSIPSIKKDADQILEKQLQSQNQIAVEEDAKIENDAIINEPTSPSPVTTEEKIIVTKNETSWMEGRKFKSRGVTYTEGEKIEPEKTVQKNKHEVAKKIDPIIIVDGKVSNVEITNLDEEELDSIIDLKEPLYIINKVYYTELELFGPNPTSPYSPLAKQNIETFTVLLPEKAAKIYGEKGKNGVVIVTTKNGKPATKKGK